MTQLNLTIYSRISLVEKDPETGERDESKVAAQEKECRDWIERNGHRVAEAVRENSESAYREWSRKKFNEVLRRMQNGEVDGVVSYVHDRLTRHPKEMEALIDLAENDGCLVFTLDGMFDLTTDSGRLGARLMVAFARGEVERKSKRHKDGNARRLADGRPPQGGGRPFGFEPDKVTIRRREAAVIRWACKRVKSGTSIRTLVREWNNAGLRTTRGQEWTRHGLRQLLLRWRNAGIREHTLTLPGGTEGETVLMPAVWPAIVDRDLMLAVRYALEARPKRPTTPARKHLLSGIATCSRCGSAVQADSTLHNGIRYWAYRCRGGRTQKVCGLSVRQDVVDDAVLDQATRWLAVPSSALVNMAETKRATQLRAERVEIMNQTKALTEADLTAEFTAILAKVAGFQKRVQAIDAELERLSENDALAALVADLVPLSGADVATWTLPAGNRETIRARLDEMRTSDLGKLRRILRSLLEVELLPWKGTGKATAETARQRLRVTRVPQPEWAPLVPEGYLAEEVAAA